VQDQRPQIGATVAADERVPFQCMISAWRWLFVPTAQALRADVAATALRSPVMELARWTPPGRAAAEAAGTATAPAAANRTSVAALRAVILPTVFSFRLRLTSRLCTAAQLADAL
jgi:hypothetical protein